MKLFNFASVYFIDSWFDDNHQLVKFC